MGVYVFDIIPSETNVFLHDMVSWLKSLIIFVYLHIL